MVIKKWWLFENSGDIDITFLFLTMIPIYDITIIFHYNHYNLLELYYNYIFKTEIIVSGLEILFLQGYNFEKQKPCYLKS